MRYPIGDFRPPATVDGTELEGKKLMNEDQAANWRDLCNAALTARDPDRLLQIIHRLNAELEREEKARRRMSRVAQERNLASGDKTSPQWRS